jgi:tetratricopeptide (TPR) repeat protein
MPAGAYSSALELLKGPEELARRLIAELERIANAQEHKQTERLESWVRKKHSKNSSSRTSSEGGALLPVPNLAIWEETSKSALRRSDPKEWWPKIEAELKSQAPAKFRSRTDFFRYWANRAYVALGVCDYQVAAVAAHICIGKRMKREPIGIFSKLDQRDIGLLQGLLAYGVASAYFGKMEEMNKTLGFALKARGARGSVSWAIGWALVLRNNARGAEPYLLEAVADRPDEVLPQVLLGSTQWTMGKLREATQSFQKAIAIDPDNLRVRTLLAHVLVVSGRGRAALDELEILDARCPTDFDVMVLLVGANLLLGENDEADRRRVLLEQVHPGVKTALQLGHLYATSKMDDAAQACFESVTVLGFYPEALVALGNIELRRENHLAARGFLLSALDLTRETGEGGRAALEFFAQVCGALISQGQAVAQLNAWTVLVILDHAVGKWSQVKLLVYAAKEAQAREYVGVLYQAMFPSGRFTEVKSTWAVTRRPQGSLVPGVYDCRFE